MHALSGLKTKLNTEKIFEQVKYWGDVREYGSTCTDGTKKNGGQYKLVQPA